MTTITHEIAGQPANGPVNWENLELEIKREGKAISLNFDSVEFQGADAHLVKQILNNNGSFQGIPYKIKIADDNDLFIHDAYLDATTANNFIGCDTITLGMKQRKGKDWLSDVADGVSFAFMYDQGTITNADFESVPYIINYIPDGPVLLTLALSVFMMSKEGYELIREIAEQTAELINAATPNVGAGVTIDVGDIIWSALKIIGRIVYAVLIVIAITKMMKEIFAQLFPLKRFHKGMKYSKLFQRGCEHFGLQFQSTIMSGYAKDMVYVPTKDKKGFLAVTQNYSGVTGLGGAGYPGLDEPIYNFGGFIRVMKEKFNADYQIKNGVLIFERKDYFEQNSTYVIPDVYTDQEGFKDDYSRNADEIKSNTLISYRYDTQDQNTLDDQTGRVWQGILQPSTITDPDLVLSKGLKKVDIPFALGKRKNDLNAYEKVVKALASVVDSLTGLFGNGTNYSGQVEGRVGCMLLSSHQISVPKVVIMQGGKIAPNQSKLNSKSLWDNFHAIDCFKEIVTGLHGQYLKYFNLDVPMCLQEFLSLVQNFNCDTSDGKKAIIDRLKWNAYYQMANMDFRVREKYDSKLTLTEIT